LQEFPGQTVDDLAEAVRAGVRAFTEGAPQSDDIAVLAVHYRGQAAYQLPLCGPQGRCVPQRLSAEVPPWWGESAQRRQNFSKGQTMALIMTERELNGITVVDMKGEIVLGEESNAFREKIKGLLMAGKNKIVLNVTNISYIDSSGVGVLVACFNSARSHDAALKLANVWSRFHEVLQMTRLLTVFDTYDSESAAIQSFTKSLRAAG